MLERSSLTGFPFFKILKTKIELNKMHLKVPGSDRCYLFSTRKKKEMWSYLLFFTAKQTHKMQSKRIKEAKRRYRPTVGGKYC